MEPQTSTKTVASPIPANRPGRFSGVRRFFKAARMLQEREKSRLREEIAQIPGLMALLMKPRNGMRWTREERKELRAQMRRLSRLSFYLVLAALPFTSLTLPLVAWWLDRRQQKRAGVNENKSDTPPAPRKTTAWREDSSDRCCGREHSS